MNWLKKPIWDIEIMTIDQAISLLKKTVKYSAVKNQKHIDLTLVPAVELNKYESALALVFNEVKKGTLTEEELKNLLGLS